MEPFVAGTRSAMDPWDGSAALASLGNASKLSLPALARQWIHGMAPLLSLRWAITVLAESEA